VSGEAAATKAQAVLNYKAALQALQGTKPAAALQIPTLRTWSMQTLEGAYSARIQDGTLAPSTWDLYETVHRMHIDRDPIGDMLMTELGPEDVERWAADLHTKELRDKLGRIKRAARPMSRSSRARYLGYLSGLFERFRVVRRGRPDNPVRDAAKPPPYAAPGHETFRILSRAETVRLIALARAHEAETYGARPRFSAAMAEQGVRRGRMVLVVLLGLHGLGPAEMAGLQHSDFEDGGFWVRRQANRGKVNTRLKTAGRGGWVAAHPVLVSEALKSPPGYLLATASGKPIRQEAIRRMFAGIVRGSEFEGMSPYDLRHTFAMRLLEEGADVRTVAEMMRSSPQVVLARYVRSRSDLKTKAAKSLKLDEEEPTE
jgi:integrase